MTDPSKRFTGLIDAEQRHREAPMSFSIPRSDVRSTLVPGSLAKLLFGFDGTPDGEVERMWVEVVESKGDRYVGRLDNEPTAIGDLAYGDRIDFRPEHVAAIWREMPDAPQPGQSAMVSSKIWQTGAPPARAVRTPSANEQLSGWILFADADPATPPHDLSGFQLISHHQLTRRYRCLDSIEDEPSGTVWRWDVGDLEWVQDVPKL